MHPVARVKKYALEKPADMIASRRMPEAIVSSATVGKKMNRRRVCRPAMTCPANAGEEPIAGIRKKLVNIKLPTQKIPPST
jgi:hypothetical protein